MHLFQRVSILCFCAALTFGCAPQTETTGMETQTNTTGTGTQNRVLQKALVELEDNTLYPDDYASCASKIREQVDTLFDAAVHQPASRLSNECSDDYLRVFDPRAFRDRNDTYSSGKHTVTIKKISGKCYGHIPQFVEGTSDAFLEQMRPCMRTKEGDPADFVLDLRGNLGGLVEEEIKISYLFSTNLDDRLLTERTSNGVELIFTIANPTQACNNPQINVRRENGLCLPFTDIFGEPLLPGIFEGHKIAILIDENTASAAEGLAGTLYEWGKASGNVTIMGTTSFGKGLVQIYMALPDDFGIAVTTAEFYVGNDAVKIHGVGIRPDIEIPDAKRENCTIPDPSCDELLDMALTVLDLDHLTDGRLSAKSE